MARPELAELYQRLMDSQFAFIGAGTFNLVEIYRTVKARYPELCDDTYLCSTNCKSGYNQPEWMHLVRTALHELKKKAVSGVTSEQRKQWIIGGKPSEVIANNSPSFTEGREVLRLHRRKERNRRAVSGKKQSVLVATGNLKCEVCDFDFQLVYGDLGSGFAECHHRIPLAELTEEYRIKLSELAIVCANCHRMLHRRQNLTVDELQEIMHAQANT